MKKIAFLSFIFFHPFLNAKEDDKFPTYLQKLYDFSENCEKVCSDEKSERCKKVKSQTKELVKACQKLTYNVDKSNPRDEAPNNPTESWKKLGQNETTKILYDTIESLPYADLLLPVEKYILAHEIANNMVLKLTEYNTIFTGLKPEDVPYPVEYLQTSIPNEETILDNRIEKLQQRKKLLKKQKEEEAKKLNHMEIKKWAAIHLREVAATKAMFEEKEKREREEQAALKAASGK